MTQRGHVCHLAFAWLGVGMKGGIREVENSTFQIYSPLVFEFFRKNKTRGKISEIFGNFFEKLEKFGKIEFEKP